MKWVGFLGGGVGWDREGRRRRKKKVKRGLLGYYMLPFFAKVQLMTKVHIWYGSIHTEYRISSNQVEPNHFLPFPK